MTLFPPTSLLRHAIRAMESLVVALAGLAAVGGLALLAAILIVVACGGPLPPASPSPTPSNAPSNPGGRGAGLAGLLIGNREGLFIGAADGSTSAIDGVRGPVAGVTSAAGTIVVRTGAGELLRGRAGGSGSWERLAITAAGAAGPFSGPSLSPDGKRLAVLAGTLGSGEPTPVAVADVVTGIGRALPIRREANGPPQWLDDRGLLLELTTDSGGPAFVRLALEDGRADPIAATGNGPALSGDKALVAVAGEELLVLPTKAWLAGTTDGSEAIASPRGGVIDLDLDGNGGRLAVAWDDPSSSGATIDVYDGSGDGWTVVSTLRLPGDGPVALDWLDR